MTIYDCKEYKKLNPSIRQAVDKCINKLENRYKEYKKQNISIANIFGDGTIIHKVIDNDFYVYKAQHNNIQIRLLYKVDCEDNIDVTYFYVKNGNNLVNTKHNKSSIQTRYISMFENYVKSYKRSVITI